jgi:hypothetical protein
VDSLQTMTGPRSVSKHTVSASFACGVYSDDLRFHTDAKLDAAPTVPSPWNASQQLYNLHGACTLTRNPLLRL